ncbi:MAG: urea amidolyase associated protein UAAP2 [Verrucomicrobiota bacterium]
MSTSRIDDTVLAGDWWMKLIRKDEYLCITDLEGNQAADTLFYNARDFADRYSAADTIAAQQSLYLAEGSTLVSSGGNAMLKITGDTCGRHDTIGGACSRESNTMRYGLHTEPMHACRDIFLAGLHAWGEGLGKRDITCNINFFMNVPVTPEGELNFADGISGPGRFVELKAEMDVVCLISNCPQLNNPCNAYNPTPVRVQVGSTMNGVADV